MVRGPCTVKETDVKRAVRAARTAGLVVQRVEIEPDGKITVVANNDKGGGAPDNEWDSVFDDDGKDQA